MCQSFSILIAPKEGHDFGEPARSQRVLFEPEVQQGYMP